MGFLHTTVHSSEVELVALIFTGINILEQTPKARPEIASNILTTSARLRAINAFCILPEKTLTIRTNSQRPYTGSFLQIGYLPGESSATLRGRLVVSQKFWKHDPQSS